MRHCCEFVPDDVYYLDEKDLYQFSRLSIGFCPICGKPITEIFRVKFDGAYERISKSGLKADRLLSSVKDKILYSVRELNYLKYKSKPYGWKYGVNKAAVIGGKECVKQYAYDFYGNKELIKTVG